jgi:hypothetical protein
MLCNGLVSRPSPKVIRRLNVHEHLTNKGKSSVETLSNVVRYFVSLSNRGIRVAQHIEVNEVIDSNFADLTLMSSKHPWNLLGLFTNLSSYLWIGSYISEFSHSGPE